MKKNGKKEKQWLEMRNQEYSKSLRLNKSRSQLLTGIKSTLLGDSNKEHKKNPADRVFMHSLLFQDRRLLVYRFYPYVQK